MSVLQLLGQIYSIARQFIGQPRELLCDTSNWDLILHDGSTEGGRRFLNQDNADQRFQARSPELDGLLNFEPQDNGYLVRLGPANYRLREITVNVNQLTVENSDAYDGNTLLGIAPTIGTEHTFTEQITFEGQILAEGGIVGNLVGDTTGVHNGNVIGDVTGNLTGNANGSHTGSFTGNLDTEGFTINMGEGQIVLSYLNQDVLDYIDSRGVPPGTIVIWAGFLNEIPDGWALCDGGNDTPDLTERYIVGAKATGDFIVGNTGGSHTHTHVATLENGGAHAHSGTVGDTALTLSQLPSHNHGNGICDNQTVLYNHGNITATPASARSVEGQSGAGTLEGLTTSVGDGEVHTHTLSTEESGAHSHTASVEASSSHAPYMALCYIMKLPYE